MSYGIHPRYRVREEPPVYCDDRLNEDQHQFEVYGLLTELARGAQNIVDIGCGNGKKLRPFALTHSLYGIDHGPNLDYCRKAYPDHHWLDYDLETSVVDLNPEILSSSVVVCADVIEHLVQPDRLIQSWRHCLNYAPGMVVSTPDREVFGLAPDGPPWNPSHIREWTQREFVQYLISEGFHIDQVLMTQGHQDRPMKETITVVLKGTYDL